jgi:hypothetical protein
MPTIGCRPQLRSKPDLPESGSGGTIWAYRRERLNRQSGGVSTSVPRTTTCCRSSPQGVPVPSNSPKLQKRPRVAEDRGAGLAESRTRKCRDPAEPTRPMTRTCRTVEKTRRRPMPVLLAPGWSSCSVFDPNMLYVVARSRHPSHRQKGGAPCPRSSNPSTSEPCS